MDYKSIIKSRTTRSKILKFLSFIPDEYMLRLQYWIKTGRILNLKNPKRFTEKIQWYKLYYRNPLMKQCVNKFAVREYVKSKGLDSILVKLYAHYDNVNDINWDEIPEKFIIKTQHGGGGLNVIAVPNKNEISKKFVITKLHYSVKNLGKTNGGREWAYGELETGIVIEQLLINRDNPDAGVNDYKILCYNGHAKYIIVDVDRYIEHKRNFYDCNWNNLHILSDCPASDREIERPKNLDDMLKFAERLSEDFPFVRVDLYNVDGKVYFGELTFYPWSGYVQFSPDEWDLKLGEDFKLKKF